MKYIKDNRTRKKQLNVLYGEETNEYVQPIANDLPLELRLMHHFVCTIFTLKIEKYEYVSKKVLFFLCAYIADSKIDLPLFVLDHMFRATMTKMSLLYKIFLTKVFKYFKIDLNNEKTRTPKPISEEYNEKTLKRIGFVFHLYNLHTLVFESLSVLLYKQNTCKLKWVLDKTTWKNVGEVLV